jgi:O-acetyl-ADP-ribose deacetylase (regulator of RNase III)
VAELNGKSVAIYNLATKNHWRNPSDIQWIVQGARRLLEWAEKNQIYSISCPALGAGLGGLPFAEVQSALTAVFKPSVVVLVLYPPR